MTWYDVGLYCFHSFFIGAALGLFVYARIRGDKVGVGALLTVFLSSGLGILALVYATAS